MTARSNTPHPLANTLFELSKTCLSDESMDVQAKRQRVVSVRYSKNACKTCRIRKVKCDEARPGCNNCLSTGRTCDGYEVGVTANRAKASKRQLLPASALHPAATVISAVPSRVTFSTKAEDCISFDFFIQNIVAGLKIMSPTHEWITLSLQLALTEPAVFFAMAACGSVANIRLGKKAHAFFTPPSPVKQKINLRQYCKAIASLQKYIDRAATGQANIEPVLLCCLMFVAYETYQDETTLALSHLRLGRRAIDDSISGRLTFASKRSEKDIVNAFDWLGSQTSSFGHSNALKINNAYHNMVCPLSPSLSTCFASVEHAKQTLDRLAAAASSWRSDLLALAAEHVELTGDRMQRPAIRECIIHCVSRSMHFPSDHLLVRSQSDLIQAHQAWLCRLAGLNQVKHTTRRDIVYMRIQHFYSIFMLQTSRNTRSLLADQFNEKAATILDLVEEYLTHCPSNSSEAGPNTPPNTANKYKSESYPYTPLPQKKEYHFSLEYALIPTILSICFRIRHGPTRHRALSLLRSANRREAGQWSGELCHYADAIIALEESLAAGLMSEEIPEQARMLEVVIERAGYLEVSIVVGRFRHERDGKLVVGEYRGAGLPPLRLGFVREGVFEFAADYN